MWYLCLLRLFFVPRALFSSPSRKFGHMVCLSSFRGSFFSLALLSIWILSKKYVIQIACQLWKLGSDWICWLGFIAKFFVLFFGFHVAIVAHSAGYNYCSSRKVDFATKDEMRSIAVANFVSTFMQNKVKIESHIRMRGSFHSLCTNKKKWQLIQLQNNT